MPKFTEYSRWQTAKSIAVDCQMLVDSKKEGSHKFLLTDIARLSLEVANNLTRNYEVVDGRPPLELSTGLRVAEKLQSDLLIGLDLGLFEKQEIDYALERLDDVIGDLKEVGRKMQEGMKAKMANRLNFDFLNTGQFEE